MMELMCEMGVENVDVMLLLKGGIGGSVESRVTEESCAVDCRRIEYGIHTTKRRKRRITGKSI